MDLGKRNSQFRWHTQTWTHVQRHSHNNGWRSNRATSSLTVDVVHLILSTSLLSLLFLPSLLFLCFLLISLRVKHFTTAFPFCQNTIFLVILSYFCYKTCTGCLEQQQKYNIQFICNFFCLIIINSLGESSWSFSSVWLFQVQCPKWPEIHSGVGGGAGYK